MQIFPPLCITARLMAGYRFDDGSYISIEYADTPGDDGRTRYHYAIDACAGREYERSDLQSGRFSTGIQSGFADLLGYLCDAAESLDDNSFEETWVGEWAASHQMELECLRIDLEEQTLIKE